MSEDPRDWLNSQCEHCHQPIEFPIDRQGYTAPCPACGKTMNLFVREAALPPPPREIIYKLEDVKFPENWPEPPPIQLSEPDIIQPRLRGNKKARVTILIWLLRIPVWAACIGIGIFFFFFRDSPFSQREIITFNTAERKANEGDVPAELTLAWCFDGGIGTKANPPEAVRWYSKAADGGNIMAKTLLGDKYLVGAAVDQNYERALKLLHDAALSGEIGAQLSLAGIYEYGTGVKMDLVEAGVWYAITYNSKYQDMYGGKYFQKAKQKLDELSAKFSSNETGLANERYKVVSALIASESPYSELFLPQKDPPQSQSHLSKYAGWYFLGMIVLSALVADEKEFKSIFQK